MYPSLLLMHPDVAESVIEYRRKTLPGARDERARASATTGAFYPWNGAGTGDLDQECHSWNPPHCLTQIHLQGDIALATWQYYLATGDTDWLRSALVDPARASRSSGRARVTANADGTYSINNVAGPDEYSNGVNDGVFTNAGAATALRNATRAAQILGEPAPSQWTTIADRLRMPFDATNQVFLQYDGYQGTLIKQADTVLLIYPLEWPMSRDGRGQHARLLRRAHRSGRAGDDRRDPRRRLGADRRAGLRHQHLPEPLDQAVRARPVRAVRRGARRQGRLAGPARRSRPPTTSSPARAASRRCSRTG